MRFLFNMLSIVALFATFVIAEAQKYEPNNKWPYIFEDFVEGQVFLKNNTKMDAKLNIHLLANKLHYVDKTGRIMECRDKDIARVEMFGDGYLCLNGKMMKIEAQEGTNLLMSWQKGDFQSLNGGSGAYGASLNSSATNNLNSLDLGGLNHPELGRMEEEKNDGRTIDVSTVYLFVVNDKIINATKSDVIDAYGKDKSAAIKAFIKANKIKWKSVESLSEVLRFLSTLE